MSELYKIQMQFRRSIYQFPGLLKHIFQKEKQEEKDSIEKERLAKIELLNQQTT